MNTANNITRADLEFTSCVVYLNLDISPAKAIDSARHLAKSTISPQKGNMPICTKLVDKKGAVNAQGDIGERTSKRFKLTKDNPFRNSMKPFGHGTSNAMSSAAQICAYPIRIRMRVNNELDDISPSFVSTSISPEEGQRQNDR